VFAAEGADRYRTESGRERGELLRVTRDADGPSTACTGRRTSSPARRSAFGEHHCA
jgi:hypothetical protein